MSQPPKTGPAACGGHCDQCAAAPFAGAADEPDALSGGRMVLASSFVFLLPLATAIAGAAWIRNDPARQLTAALAGFAGGVVAAALLTRLLRRPRKAGS
ncbi:MAG: hypothetical protein KA248_08855 [Kiritimatiellae bacterium]|nr:hypothetical protein [Kiritimatiellia bacterium]